MPAYDINPVAISDGLSFNISEHSNLLDFELALEFGEYFRLKSSLATSIVSEVKMVVSLWQKKAKALGISRGDGDALASVFRF